MRALLDHEIVVATAYMHLCHAHGKNLADIAHWFQDPEVTYSGPPITRNGLTYQKSTLCISAVTKLCDSIGEIAFILVREECEDQRYQESWHIEEIIIELEDHSTLRYEYRPQRQGQQSCASLTVSGEYLWDINQERYVLR